MLDKKAFKGMRAESMLTFELYSDPACTTLLHVESLFAGDPLVRFEKAKAQKLKGGSKPLKGVRMYAVLDPPPLVGTPYLRVTGDGVASVGDACQLQAESGGGGGPAGPTGPQGPTGPAAHTKCFVVESPIDADNFLFFRAASSTTVTAVDCIVAAATSAAVAVQECDANGGGCEVTDIASGTCSVTNISLAVTNSDVQAGDWVRVDIGAISGSPGHVTVCVSFTQ